MCHAAPEPDHEAPPPYTKEEQRRAGFAIPKVPVSFCFLLVSFERTLFFLTLSPLLSGRPTRIRKTMALGAVCVGNKGCGQARKRH